MTRIRNFAIVCLVALFVVYCGISMFESVYTTINAKESVSLGVVLLSRNSTMRLGFIAMGDPIDDPRPHKH